MIIKKLLRVIYILLFFLITVNVSFCAQEDTQIIINSREWQDVYSGSIYGNILGIENHFLNDYTSVGDFLLGINPDKKDVILIENKNNKIIPTFSSVLEEKGYNIVKTYEGDIYENNLDLYEELDTDTVYFMEYKHYVDAMTFIPKITYENSYMLFVSRNNIEEIADITAGKTVYQVSVTDREITSGIDAITTFTPTIIKEKSYELNQMIVTELFEKFNSKSLILSNGDVFETEILMGTKPILIIGKDVIPISVINFINDNNVSIGILIGASYLESASLLKDKTDMKILVKIQKAIANGLPDTKTAIERKALDMFMIIPKESKINILDITYNKADKEFLVELENEGEEIGFFQTNLFIKQGDETLASTSSAEIESVGNSNKITQKIPYELDENLENLEIDIQIFYGEEQGAIDKEERVKKELKYITLLDDSKVNVEDIVYNTKTKRFEISITNTGKKEVYVSGRIYDLLVAEEKTEFFSSPITIKKDEIGILEIKAILDEVDLADNSNINLILSYGETENLLIKSFKDEFAYNLKSGMTTTIIIVVVVIVVLIAGAVTTVLIIKKKPSSKKKKNKK